MKYYSEFVGGPFDGLMIETQLPLSSVILRHESVGDEQVADGVKSATVEEAKPSAYETWRTDEYDDREVRQMTYTGEALPE